MKLICLTIDWMKYYVGEGDEEKPVPLCGYNFQYINGMYYGYGEGVDTLPTVEDDEEVLVVWLSPNRDGDRCIIGWYKNATLYTSPKRHLTLDSERFEMSYTVSAKAEDCLLLPVEERRYAVNTLTQTVEVPENDLIKAQIMAYIHQYNGDHMNLVLSQEDLGRAMTLNLNYEQYFYKADEFLARDSYAKAIKCFNKAIQEAPEETLGFECKGSVLLSLKMYDEAITCYEEVIARDQENALAHYCLGLLHGLKRDFDTALTYYNHYLLERPEDTVALAERGLVYYELGLVEQGQKEVETALSKDQDNAMIQKLNELLSK